MDQNAARKRDLNLSTISRPILTTFRHPKGAQNGTQNLTFTKKCVIFNLMRSPFGVPGADWRPRDHPKRPRPQFYGLFIDVVFIFNDCSWILASSLIILAVITVALIFFSNQYQLNKRLSQINNQALMIHNFLSSFCSF